jgi:hypothetical protein
MRDHYAFTEDSSLFEEGFVAFAGGFSPGNTMSHVPRDEWPRELTRIQSEENLWWKGPTTSAELVVELPFWLMIEDGSISITVHDTTLRLNIRSDFVEVSNGPVKLTSASNVVSVGPEKSLAGKEFSELTESRMPIFRRMRTVAVLPVLVLEEALSAIQNARLINEGDRPAIRSVNRSIAYLDTLAFAHIPFLNALITSYRSASLDPFAFEVSEWDVPIWYVTREEQCLRINMMRYFDVDEPPSYQTRSGRHRFHATTWKTVEDHARSGVAAGKLELLDALSLQYRGRYEDAVRSIVTAIEVSVEAKISELLRARGQTDGAVAARLDRTRNSFHDRLSDYEQLSGRRIPGPLLCIIPYINGIRLQGELEWVRRLRHKIVHEGQRVDIFSRGIMLRAIETMTWLCHWLSHGSLHDPSGTRNYTFFSFLRGEHLEDFRFEPDHVVVVSRRSQRSRGDCEVAEDAVMRQFRESLEPETRDLELCVSMGLQYLGVPFEDAPPAVDAVRMQERFRATIDGSNILVYCLDLDGMLSVDLVNTIIAATCARKKLDGRDWGACIVVNHQRQLASELREVRSVFSGDVLSALEACGVAGISALDLQKNVVAGEEFNWDKERLRHRFLAGGRQFEIPPCYQAIGVVTRVYPKLQVISVSVWDEKIVRVGERIGVPNGRWICETGVESLQLERIAIHSVKGPCQVGIEVPWQRGVTRVGQMLYLRR